MLARNDTIWLILRKMRVPLIVLIVTHSISAVFLTLANGVDPTGKPWSMSFFDAFYFVAYTATTLGYGEIPYAFSYSQRFAAALTIYLTIPAWFYAVGTIVRLLQDRVFLQALSFNTFSMRVRRIREPFIVICGYNTISQYLIERINAENDYRILVIDLSNEKIDELHLHDYHPSIPAISADATSTTILKAAGLESPYCRYVVTLFDDDDINLKVSVKAKIINPRVKIVGKSTLFQGVQNLKDIGVDKVIDPFYRVAKRIEFALFSPYLFTLLNWLNGGNLNLNRSDKLPTKGKYIVCSRGRFGKALKSVFENNSIDFVYLDMNKEIKDKEISDRDFFVKAGIEEASCLIAGTADDAINLSLVLTARKLNPHLFVMVRENELEENSMFANLRVQKIFVIDRIIAINAYNFIARPLVDTFIDHLKTQNDEWGKNTVTMLTKRINKKPLLTEFSVNFHDTYALMLFLQEGHYITLESLFDNTPYPMKVCTIAIQRNDGEFIMMPPPHFAIIPDDTLLLSGTEDSLEEARILLNNYNDLHKVLKGEYPTLPFFRRIREIVS